MPNRKETVGSMSDLEATFPELAKVENEVLRARVVDIWAIAVADSEFDSIADVPWWQPLEAIVGTYGLVDTSVMLRTVRWPSVTP